MRKSEKIVQMHKRRKNLRNFSSYSSAIKNLEQTQGTWRQAPTAARHEAQLERFRIELKVKKLREKCVRAWLIDVQMR